MKVFPIILVAGTLFASACEIMPYNTLPDCREQQCKDSKKSKACYQFCDCIHKDGQPLDSCLAKYNKAPQDVSRKKQR